jgi:hypothetical protein
MASLCRALRSADAPDWTDPEPPGLSACLNGKPGDVDEVGDAERSRAY